MLPFYGVIIIPLVYIGIQLDFHKDNKGLILGKVCLLFARVTMDTQVKILTSQPLSCNIMYNLVNISFISLFLCFLLIIIF